MSKESLIELGLKESKRNPCFHVFILTFLGVNLGREFYTQSILFIMSSLTSIIGIPHGPALHGKVTIRKFQLMGGKLTSLG